MPQIIETVVYRLDELDERARESARDWYRANAADDDWHEFTFDDFTQISGILGLSLATRSVRLMGGGSRVEPKIYFSGFSSQGDGACFEGEYRFVHDILRRIRNYAPEASDLHGIVRRLVETQRRNFYQLTASIRHSGRYCHEYSMTIPVSRHSPTGQDVSLADEEIVIEALRDLARWLYRQLEAEHDYRTANAQVDEAIRANDFTFTENGRRFG